MNAGQRADNGIYYFLGNITSHILHALPLHRELGGTFVVLSEKAKQEVEKYGVPVIAIDDKPSRLTRFGFRFKPVYHYLTIDKSLRKTVDYLNKHARVVLFYELYDFEESVCLTKPRTVFLTHGNMLKDYMAGGNRLEVLKQYGYMAALGPYLKKQFIEKDGIDPAKLVDIGIARTDDIVKNKGKVTLPESLVKSGDIDAAKKIISYLPTFWGPSSIYNIGKKIIRNFPDEYTLLFRPHPQTPQKLLREYFEIIAAKPGNVIYAPEGKYENLGLLEILSASSAIIGDVSSVMLEAILLEKPLIFAYDSGEHKQSDGDYRAIGEVIAHSQKIDAQNIGSLGKILETSLKNGVNASAWHEVEIRNFFHCAGGSAAAIARFVRQIA
jgi:CDP-glycerol glycerophosphotransferase (TagB/SpsB family)